MSGPRPLHLSRRGAMYVVRLTFPKELRDVTGVIDIRRSLQTKSIDVARERCLDAEIWFSKLIRQLRSMDNPTRHDIEMAAASYFVSLREEIDQPRDWDPYNYDFILDFNIEETRRRIRELNDQLRDNVFSEGVKANARYMLTNLSISLDALDGKLALFAQKMAAKAERQQMRYFEHVLVNPGAHYYPDDPVFDERYLKSAPFVQPKDPFDGPNVLETIPMEEMSLLSLIEDHKASLIDQGHGESSLQEVGRIFRWLLDDFGPDRPVTSISTSTLRPFRDKLRSINKFTRSPVKDGLKSLNDSLTAERSKQIQSVTARRYWSFVKNLFSRAVSEGFLEVDPASSLVVPLRKDEEPKSPEPYSTEELKLYFSLPVFTGCQSRSRRKQLGNHRVRDGHFWSGLLQAYTGMRGGELSQLLPEDFVFSAEVAHILIRRENAEGERVKSAKTKSSIRAIPVADDLLVLGLRQFVEGRTKRAPKDRVFAEFPLGTGGKKSNGLSKFWRDYIIHFGLHKPGRATHVWRHTVIYHLRKRGVTYEDVGYLVGHKVQSETSNYGPGELLERVRTHSLERLDYGFDVVSMVGGPYNPKFHAE